jgi:hypothetical protein
MKKKLTPYELGKLDYQHKIKNDLDDELGVYYGKRIENGSLIESNKEEYTLGWVDECEDCKK